MVTTAEKWRIGLLLFVIVLLLIALLGLVVRFAIQARSDVAESAPRREIPNTDINPFGANFFLQWEAELFKREKTVEMAAQAGIGWAKQQFPWEDIEPSPGQYRWDKYDDIVDLYREYGLQVIARLDRPPDWTRADNRYPQRPPDDFNDYGDFVEQFVRHFKGRVRYIQIWNEPNIFPEWGDQPVDPAAYTRLLGIAYRRAKGIDPNIYILSAPLAINVEDFPGRRNLSDLIFLEEMYQAGAADYFDILSANAFGMDRPPKDPPDPGVLNFRRVELQREIMVRYGDNEKPIWFNEYGWNAAPANLPPEKLIWQRVSEEQQAAWTVEGIHWARERWPWAGVFNIWYFRQIGNLSPNDADYYFRMVDADFTPRRVYYAVQQATRDVRVARPGYHQETAPSVHPDDAWRPRIEPQASAEADIVANSEGATLTFAFDGTGVDLVARSGPHAGRLAATIDGKPVPGLPRDGNDRSIVDLAATEPVPSTTFDEPCLPRLPACAGHADRRRRQVRTTLQRNSGTVSSLSRGQASGRRWQSRIRIARDWPAGQHTLRLTLLDGEAAIDAFVVPLDNAPAFPLVPVAACAFGLAAAGWLLYRDVAEITESL